MLNKGGKKTGVSGRRSLGSGDVRVGEVKAVRPAPGGVDRRVDVVMKDAECLTKREKASVYMHRKNAKELKTGKKYEFELEKREMDKERGAGRRMGAVRKTYRCETPPVEQVAGGSTFKNFGSKEKNLGKWFSAH
ncbi:MAG: hypothetical protein EOM26_06985 [Alphaproteobacteria bacterium]|nr:hypothetical protein [Alphaproteobacteria bacterium]